MKEEILESVEELLRNINRVKRTVWVKEEVVKMINERRSLKNEIIKD